MIPWDRPVIKIVDAYIEQNIKDKSKIEKWEVETIHLFTNPVLDTNFNTEEPEWLNQKVKEDQQG